MIPTKFIVEHYDYLLWKSSRYLFCREDRLDLVQDTILKALKYAETSQPNNVKAWLNQIMFTLFLDRLRVKKQFVELEEIPISPSPDIMIDYQYIVSQVKDLKTKLVILSTQGYSYEELSKEFNIPMGTLKCYIYKGRKQLCSLMK